MGCWWESLVARTAMVEVDVKVPVRSTARARPYVNLDHGASAPAIAGVLAIVPGFTTW